MIPAILSYLLKHLNVDVKPAVTSLDLKKEASVPSLKIHDLMHKLNPFTDSKLRSGIVCLHPTCTGTTPVLTCRSEFLKNVKRVSRDLTYNTFISDSFSFRFF